MNQVLVREMKTYEDEFSTLGVDPALVGGTSSGEVGRGRRTQPSIPKSSVNFLTFSRSSVLTVGRVVDRDRSMSDCKQSR